jgi:integrase/recombinase XerC
LRSFFDWLVAQGELAANPAKVSPPRKFPVTYLKILMSMTSTGCWISILTIRWRCATGRCWKVMYGAGLRLSELVNLILSTSTCG